MMGQEVIYKSEPSYWGGVYLCFNHAVKVAGHYVVKSSIELEGFYKQHPCKVCESESKTVMEISISKF